MVNPSVENLYRMADDRVRAQVLKVFTMQLQNAPSVRATFFASVAESPVVPVDRTWVDRVASALVSSSISRSSLFGFARTIDQGAADGFWQCQLAPGSAAAIQESRAIYDWAFPMYCQSDGVTFESYLGDKPASWAAELAAWASSEVFIDTRLAELVARDAEWLEKLNLVLYKLHRLDPAQVSSVVKAWATAFPTKGVVEQWQSYNFVGSSFFKADGFLAAVNTAIGVSEDRAKDPPGSGDGVVYGAKVEAFVSQVAQGLGLAGESSPGNVRSGRACFLPGTPVHLRNGQIVPIEAVAEGHQVLARDGAPSVRTAEEVVVRFRGVRLLCGINDVAPFFTPGHLFWTRSGWKAVDPDAALEENPDREVGKLALGDVVFRLKSTDPVAYEEVTVKALPSAWLPAGSEGHALHLSGEPSYHVHGFLVAMNHPQITVAAMTRAFAKMTPAERELVRRQLGLVMPLLSKAIGSFVEPALRKALG